MNRRAAVVIALTFGGCVIIRCRSRFRWVQRQRFIGRTLQGCGNRGR